MPPRQLFPCIPKNNLPIAVALESSAIAPRYAVDTDGCPFGHSTKTAVFHSSLRSQHGHGTFPFDHHHVLSHLFIFGYGR